MPIEIESPPIRTSVGNYFISNYPPFSCWNVQQIPELLLALSRNPKPGPIGLYVHLPFCRHRCHYCYFRVYPRRQRSDVDLYIESLLRELGIYRRFPAVRERTLSSVYFGGGSPSFLEPDQIAALLSGLRNQWSWDAVEECTFECEPGTITLEKLRTLKQFGVTRLSLGFQSLHDDLLRRAGRDVTVADCIKAFQLARQAGFHEINIDLLAGLPGETEATWRRTINQVLELVPDCVTIYQMELTHNSALYASMKAGRELELPTWSAKREWTAQAFRMCEEAGYTIGSGYMAIRDPKKWRFVYTVEQFWHGADLVALGETAFGHIQGVHYQNTDTFEQYIGFLSLGRLPLRRALRLNAEEKLRREIILQLKTGALDLRYFRRKFNTELLDQFQEVFSTLLQSGLAKVEKDQIFLTRDGLLQVDRLLPGFYLPEHVGVRYT